MDVALVVLAIVVALVTIDATARLDDRRARQPERDPAITTQKIVVDLTSRERRSRGFEGLRAKAKSSDSAREDD